MNAEIEKKARGVVDELCSYCRELEQTTALDRILEACRFTEQKCMERAAGICRGIRHTGYVPPEDGCAAGYYNSAALECAEAIEAAAKDVK